MTTLIVTGHPAHTDKSLIIDVLNAAHLAHNFKLVVEGGGDDGADIIASRWAVINRIPVKPYPADWKIYGREVVPKRNALMIKNHPKAIVITFPLEGSRDIYDLVRQAKEKRMKVFMYGPEEVV